MKRRTRAGSDPTGGMKALVSMLALLLVVAVAAPALAAPTAGAEEEEQCRCGKKCRCKRRGCDRDRSREGCRGRDGDDTRDVDDNGLPRNEVERVAVVLDLEPGMVFAEVGAGNGRFAVRLADRVGPEGRVYANELGERRIRNIEQRIQRAGADNVVAVEGTSESTNLPAGEIDALMMRMVYHMMTDPEPMNRSFYEALAPGGTMLIIDGYPKNGSNAPGVPANRSGMGIDPQITIDEVTSAGFELVELIERWPSVGYALVFKKPAS